MSANVESMFYVREAPWHGLGTRVAAALGSKEALEKSGLDWNVIQKPIVGDRKREIQRRNEKKRQREKKRDIEREKQRTIQRSR